MQKKNPSNDLGPCPICGRPMPKGAAVDRICHKKIHSLYDERTLARELNTPAALLAREEMQRFVGWVRKQPLEKIGRHRRPSRR